jgi:phage head maturation protease
MKYAEKLVNLVACGQASTHQMDELGESVVANIKSNPQTLQVRSRGSDIITKNDDKRQISYLVSDETPDRVGDIIKVKGWDLVQYRKNPVILWAHDGSSVPPIGRSTNIRRRYTPDARLTADVEFAPKEAYEFADTIYQLASRGFIKATSVGFMPLETMDLDKKAREEMGLGRYGQVFTRSELMEISIVSVPANPSALELGMKQLIREGKFDKGLAAKFFDAYPKDQEAVEQKIRAACRSFVDMGAAWDLHGKAIEPDTYNGQDPLELAMPEALEPELEEKSPTCRQEGESVKECVSRKTAEMIGEGMEEDQATAAAYSMCDTACSEKEEVAPVKKDVEKLEEAYDLLVGAAELVKSAIDEYSGNPDDGDYDDGGPLEMAASRGEIKQAETLAMALLIEQQAEQTKATRQLVDSLTDLTKSIHGDLHNGPSRGGSVHEPEAAQPDVVENDEDELARILESTTFRGFAERVRRDISNNNNTLKRNSNV